jgi:hypothetical protein
LQECPRVWSGLHGYELLKVGSTSAPPTVTTSNTAFCFEPHGSSQNRTSLGLITN